MQSSSKPFHASRLITKTLISCVLVQSLPGNRQKGRISAGPLRFPCALGKGGVSHKKREGDGATPLGSHPLRRLWYRADRQTRPRSGLLIRRIRPCNGWCDAPEHRRYNKPVPLPCPVSHETLWRRDPLYDLVIEIGWNDQPVIKNRGSAIFFHLARAGYTPTEGCVAIAGQHMRRLLPLLGPRTRIVIQ
jgi:L,D-peptidoglycan transpeptidase YkuD (ErfK/YbiS/YcfS/YnhG family)